MIEKQDKIKVVDYVNMLIAKVNMMNIGTFVPSDGHLMLNIASEFVQQCYHYRKGRAA